MSDQIYKPKNCAFHPKELIFNFCKNSDCLLPLCPSCIKIHSEQHRSEQTYGQFENMNKVVSDLNDFFTHTTKELNNYCQDITDHQVLRVKEQEELKKKIGEAKNKMITLVQRFFSDFEKQVNKSVLCYNESMKENYKKVDEHISQMKKQIQEKSNSLSTDKVLKILIGFHSRGEQQKYQEQIQCIKNRLDYLSTQKVEVICQATANQKVIDELGRYIHLSYQNWQNEVKYVTEFVKTGFTNSNEGGSTLRY